MSFGHLMRLDNTINWIKMRNLLHKLVIFPPFALFMVLGGCSSFSQNDSTASYTCPTNKKASNGATCAPRVKVNRKPQYVARVTEPKYLDHTVSWMGERRSGSAYNKAGYRHVIYHDDLQEGSPGAISQFDNTKRAQSSRKTSTNSRSFKNNRNKRTYVAPSQYSKSRNFQNDVNAVYLASKKKYVQSYSYQVKAKPKYKKPPSSYISLYKRYCKGEALSMADWNTIKIMGGLKGVPVSLSGKCNP